MTNLRSLSSASASAPAAPSAASAPANRQRLRAVAPDEVPPVADLLHPGATWLPAPPHTLPILPGHPPMVGYLVLVPADRQRPEAAGPPPEGIPAVTGETGETGDELIRIDPDHRTAEVAGRPLDLTYLEFELLSHLVAHPHRVHSRDQLVTTVWGYGHVGDGRTVDVHVARLRRKMGSEHRGTIVTVRRVGYKYVPTV
ncbi:winged helix-turn-helix domain-containing protein [Streptomyces sp. NEAU-YJ-81]|uniref:winged helix-turn-helix domain-containing protein n=1 Tax=Streptomyces sp. NEAU-YJ-81 TaxID=2820288 RepID=UPI001ABC62BF|nr:winged helix-turn-helix domain-containing protein [Streptomyces sp. NEAU-YJ-81]MBO3680698.1 winged helix-turn-helix transcriptional regulator [Streptomyces sp. NEAU-YJ-81]